MLFQTLKELIAYLYQLPVKDRQKYKWTRTRQGFLLFAVEYKKS